MKRQFTERSAEDEEVGLETRQAGLPWMASCPAKWTRIPRSCSDFLNLVFGLLNRLTESFCSSVGQHCQGQGGQVISKSNYTRRGVERG